MSMGFFDSVTLALIFLNPLMVLEFSSLKSFLRPVWIILLVWFYLLFSLHLELLRGRMFLALMEFVELIRERGVTFFKLY